MWSRCTKGTSINNICSTILYQRQNRHGRDSKTLNLVIEADQSLRTQIDLVDGIPVQYHVPYEPEQFPVLIFSYQSGRNLPLGKRGYPGGHPLYRHPFTISLFLSQGNPRAAF